MPGRSACSSRFAASTAFGPTAIVGSGRTSVVVSVREREFNRVVWPEYSRLQTELESYFEDVTDHLVSRVMGSDGDDSGLDR